MSNDQSDDSGFQYQTATERGVSQYTDDLLAFLLVTVYMTVWAASKIDASIPTPPFGDITVSIMVVTALIWVFGKRAVSVASERIERR